MPKGISPVVSVMMILLIAISVTMLAAFWITGASSSIEPDLDINNSYTRSRACLSVDDISDSGITVKNCGKVVLSDFRLYIDGNLVDNPDIGPLEPLESAQFYSTSIPSGVHVMYMTSDYAETVPRSYDFPSMG
jgi:hypothetical protein